MRQITYLISHWVFEALLLKTALTLPLIFHLSKKEDESIHEMVARSRKLESRVSCAILVFLLFPIAPAVMVYLYSDSNRLFFYLQSLSLVLIVLYLRR